MFLLFKLLPLREFLLFSNILREKSDKGDWSKAAKGGEQKNQAFGNARLPSQEPTRKFRTFLSPWNCHFA